MNVPDFFPTKRRYCYKCCKNRYEAKCGKCGRFTSQAGIIPLIRETLAKRV